MRIRAYLLALAQDRERGSLAAAGKFFLWLLSLVFGVITRCRAGAYRLHLCPSVRLPCPVISVGNLTVGGVGKTPFIAMLASYAHAQGRKAAILMRGYMPSVREEPQDDGTVFSDEARMLQGQLKGQAVLGVGADRVATARDLLGRQPVDLFLLDDGFQHLRLQRDLDIVLLDARCPFGNGHVLPRGLLREGPLALKRADVVALTKVDAAGQEVVLLEQRVVETNPRATIVHAIHAPQGLFRLQDQQGVALSSLQGCDVCALSSIGDPEYFLSTVRSEQAHIKRVFQYPDHHWYTPADLQEVMKGTEATGTRILVTTEKDAVKLDRQKGLLQGCEVWVMRVEMKIVKGEQDLYERLDRVLLR